MSEKKTPAELAKAAIEAAGVDLPRMRGTVEILSDLIISEGGWSPRAHRTPIKERKDETGAWQINYTFDAPNNFYQRKVEPPYYDYTEEEREVVRVQFEKIERWLNVKFRESPPLEADICYYKVALSKKTDAGMEDGYHNIFIHPEYVIPRVALHETMHALGFQHPGIVWENPDEVSYNSQFSADDTILSSNDGVVPAAVDLGPTDINAGQYVYGANPNAPVAPQNLEAADLLYTRALHLPPNARLDLKGGSGSLEISGERITGTLALENTAGEVPVRLGLIGETSAHRLKDIVADPQCEVTLHLTGNLQPNILSGGKNNDRLFPAGGNDTLTGNGGRDEFFIDAMSKFDNVITDFNPGEDSLMLQEEIKRVEMTAQNNFPAGRILEPGTHILCFKDDAPIASVFVTAATPEQITNRITRKPEEAEAALEIAFNPKASEEISGTLQPDAGLPPQAKSGTSKER